MTTQLSTPEARELDYWRDMAERRVRLAWAALIIGVILGCALWAIISMPPVWIEELTCA